MMQPIYIPIWVYVLAGLAAAAVLGGLVLIVVLAMNRKKDGPVERNMIACPDCGRMNSASDKFCPQCGKQFGSPEA
ncbi:MAG: zinc ribbon domain-containing protein [Planctomycetes bacterium]|nr:zinc ribbon domain-containing protein [Planctomycetota bacterium]